jgi:hypothetical protein
MRNGGAAILVLLSFFLSVPAGWAQTMEMAGTRAPGMGGAFVAVASDSSATWWNPAGLAAGPFVDLAIARNSVQADGDEPRAWRGRLSSVTFGTPPVGLSYYRFTLTDTDSRVSTATAGGDRQSTRTEVAIRSIPASQLGITLVHSLIPGIHIGSTLKYVRGDVVTTTGAGRNDDLLDVGDSLDGHGDGTLDLDIGGLAVFGPLRLGGIVRNVRQAEVGGSDGASLPRQVRVGAAFDGDAAGLVPLTIAVDADVRRYEGPAGARRVVAVGGEEWWAGRRLGVRAGVRVNTVGAEEWAATGGISVAIRSGLYVDAHVVHGGVADERGWGVAGRVSF